MSEGKPKWVRRLNALGIKVTKRDDDMGLKAIMLILPDDSEIVFETIHDYEAGYAYLDCKLIGENFSEL